MSSLCKHTYHSPPIPRCFWFLMKLLAAKRVYNIMNHFLFEGLNDRYAVLVCIYRIHQYIRRIMAAIDTII